MRLAYGALLAFLFFSFQSRTLSFLWHGAHYPNSLDFRYAFVFVFLVLAIAYQAAGDELALKMKTFVGTAALIFVLLLVEQKFQLNDTLSHWRIVTFIVFSVGYLMVFSEMRKPDFRRRRPDEDSVDKQSESALPLQQGVLYSLFMRKKPTGRISVPTTVSDSSAEKDASTDKDTTESTSEEAKNVSARHHALWDKLWHLRNINRKKILPHDKLTRFGKLRYQRALTILFTFMLTEVLFHAITSAALYQQVAPLGDRHYYTNKVHASEIYQHVADLKRENKGRPWRAEVLPDTCVNDPFLYGTNGLSLFASPYPKAPIAYFSDLGYPTNGVNSMQYKESTIVMDSLLSINHLIVINSRVFDDRSRMLVATGRRRLCTKIMMRFLLAFRIVQCWLSRRRDSPGGSSRRPGSAPTRSRG